MRGFLSGDHSDRIDDFVSQMNEWLANGLVFGQEDIHDGLGCAPGAFIGMLEGSNLGKTLIRI